VDALYLNPVNALFSPKDPRFVHYIPIADEEGRLMIDKDWRAGSSWGSLCISAFADKPLAWAFTRELLSVSVNYIPSYTADDINGVGIHSMSTPIKKSYYRSHAVTAINQSMDKGRETQTFNGFEEDKRDETINGVLARLDAYNNMPAAISPPIPPDLYKDALDAYLLEPSTPLSAQKAAEDINNKISLWLMETAG
jgi:hypothetical protein